MIVSRKHILFLTIALALFLSVSTRAQTTLQWDMATDNLLGEVDITDEPATDVGHFHSLDGKAVFTSTHRGSVIQTADGGLTWKLVYDGFTDGGNNYYFFLSARDWFSEPSQDGRLWGRTLDAGKHWELYKNPKCPWLIPSFLSADIGWGVSESSVCATKDGGKTWSVVAEHPGGLSGLRAIFMLDNAHGWVAAGASVLVTTDGSHWIAQPFDPSVGAVEIHFFDQKNGFAKAFGRPGGKDLGTIFYSKDGGRHWDRSNWDSPEVTGSASLLSDCAIQGERGIWVVRGGSSVFHSGDAGASFQSVGKLPDGVRSATSLAVASQQSKPVLLLLDSKGALWRAFLPTN